MLGYTCELEGIRSPDLLPILEEEDVRGVLIPRERGHPRLIYYSAQKIVCSV